MKHIHNTILLLVVFILFFMITSVLKIVPLLGVTIAIVLSSVFVHFWVNYVIDTNKENIDVEVVDVSNIDDHPFIKNYYKDIDKIIEAADNKNFKLELINILEDMCDQKDAIILANNTISVMKTMFNIIQKSEFTKYKLFECLSVDDPEIVSKFRGYIEASMHFNNVSLDVGSIEDMQDALQLAIPLAQKYY